MKQKKCKLNVFLCAKPLLTDDNISYQFYFFFKTLKTILLVFSFKFNLLKFFSLFLTGIFVNKLRSMRHICSAKSSDLKSNKVCVDFCLKTKKKYKTIKFLSNY
jgi:hypothetical protein